MPLRCLLFLTYFALLRYLIKHNHKFIQKSIQSKDQSRKRRFQGEHQLRQQRLFGRKLGNILYIALLKQKDIESIAKLPSKEVLIAQVVSILKSPLSGLVFTLGGLLNKLVIVLNQIAQKRKIG